MSVKTWWKRKTSAQRFGWIVFFAVIGIIVLAAIVLLIVELSQKSSSGANVAPTPTPTVTTTPVLTNYFMKNATDSTQCYVISTGSFPSFAVSTCSLNLGFWTLDSTNNILSFSVGNASLGCLATPRYNGDSAQAAQSNTQCNTMSVPDDVKSPTIQHILSTITSSTSPNNPVPVKYFLAMNNNAFQWYTSTPTPLSIALVPI